MSFHNEVDVGAIGEFVEAVKRNADAAKIKFRASSKWKGGTKGIVSVTEFLSNDTIASPAGRSFEINVDEPGVLGGSDSAPNPVEYLAAGLCGCITAGIATNAELFSIPLEKLEVDVDIDFDVLGLLAVDRSVPTGATGIRYAVRLKGKEGVTREQLERCKSVIDKKSPVRNTLANAVPIQTEVLID